MNDHVICSMCDMEQIVRRGSDECLNCRSEGTLKWASNDPDKYEVEKEPKLIGRIKGEKIK